MRLEDKTHKSYKTYFFRMFAALLSVATCAVADKASGAQARWEDVIKAAEKEGEVTVYATNSVGDLQVIWDAFKKKFPKIKLNSVGISTTSEIVTKVMAERRANQYLVDVMLGAPGATYNSFYRGKALEPMPPALVLPEVTRSVQVVEGQAPLRRSRRAVRLRLSEHALWAAVLHQYQAGWFGVAPFGLGFSRSKMEGQDDRAMAARQLRLDGAAFHVSSPASRTEISRKILWR